MGTSLIGKAVDFGSKEYGFEPRVSNMYYNPVSLISNHVNLALSKKSFKNKVVLTKANLKLLKLLRSVGCVNNLSVLSSHGNHNFITFSVFLYRNSTFFYKVRPVSTSSKKFFLSYRALKMISTNLKSTLIILSTSKGLISHKEALYLKIGGLILFVIS